MPESAENKDRSKLESTIDVDIEQANNLEIKTKGCNKHKSS
jgi:hypothetical protein